MHRLARPRAGWQLWIRSQVDQDLLDDRESTIFRASRQVADIDHGYYADRALTLARHPSETDDRMRVRLAALVLNAHQLVERIGSQSACCPVFPPAVRFTGRRQDCRTVAGKGSVGRFRRGRG